MNIVIVSASLLVAAHADPTERTLAERLHHLLDSQSAVRNATAKLDKAAAAKVSAKQNAIIAESTAILAKLKGDASAVAFSEVFAAVLADMKRVQTRLAKADGGKATQALEEAIIGTLKEMIHALTKSHELLRL